jgi:hypothetical protein
MYMRMGTELVSETLWFKKNFFLYLGRWAVRKHIYSDDRFPSSELFTVYLIVLYILKGFWVAIVDVTCWMAELFWSNDLCLNILA